MSISSTGVSAGGMIVAPIASWLIDVGGLQLATPILGGLVIVAGVPVVLGILAWEPRQMGLQPDGGWEPAKPQARALSTESQMKPWMIALDRRFDVLVLREGRGITDGARL